MSSLFLTDAADSKRVELEDYSSREAQITYLRLRLEVLFRILLGGKLLISEGWALDSLPFLRVAKEVTEAAAALRTRTNYVAGVEKFSPFAMELRREGGYVDALVQYMERPNVRWSGYGPLRDNPEHRSRVAARLREGAGRRRPRSADLVVETMAEALGNEDVAIAIGAVARYFGEQKQDRIVSASPDPRGFEKWFVRSLDLVKAAGSDERSAHVAEPLVRFADNLRRRAIDLSTSSPAMRFAEETLDEGERKAVFHLVNFAYMRVSADAAAASVSTPSLDYLSPPILLFAESALRNESLSTELAGELTFEFSLPAESILRERLKSSNWMPIWECAIALSFSEEWRVRVEALCKEAAKGLSGSALADTKAFSQLVDMLEKECPQLCLRQSGADRLSLALRSKWIERTAERAIAAGVAVGVGYIGEVILPQSGLLGAGVFAGAANTAKPILPELTRIVNPFAPDGCWSTRSTVFQIRRT